MDLRMMQRSVRVLDRVLSSKNTPDEVRILAAGTVIRIAALDIMRGQLNRELADVSEQLADIQRRLGKKAK